jgi:hypothetical protein
MLNSLEFVHITKTAGTSIEDWGRINHIRWGYQKRDVLNNIPRSILGESWHIPARYFASTPFPPYCETFCVVRNPYTRIISEYYCPWIGSPKWNLHNQEEFNRWIRTFSESILRRQDAHGLPQYLYLPIDHIIRFENLQNEFT